MGYSKSNVIAILLAALVAVEAVLYVQLQISHAHLNSAHEVVNEEFSSLQGLYSELDSAYHLLRTSSEALDQSYKTLQQQYGILGQSYTDLLEDHNLEAALRLGNSLESYFDYLRKEKVPSAWPTYQRKADFGAKLALHGLGVNCWPSLEDAYYHVARERSYKSAKERINSVIDAIGVTTYDSPTEKIRKILDFISDHIAYEEEIEEVFLAPAETLAFRSGDCDDFSVLASCLFEALGIDAAFGIFRNSNDKYHCMVLVHLDELEGNNYLSFSDLARYGLDEGRWIVIEPQDPLDRQDLEWIGQWTLLVAAPLDTN